MHGKDTFSEFREFINTMESRVQELGKVHGVEHLAGPQGFAVKYLSDNQDKEIFIKD
ncbi:MAG: MarR family transcriptional regulator, partial [Streptococcus salivarius]